MIAQQRGSGPDGTALLYDLRSAGIEVDDTLLTRSLYAHDASNYRIPPMCVAFPRDADQVARIARACHRHGVPITARGAGTGMAGNSIGSGVVLDFRRYMHRIEAIDPAARLARVEPGVVLDDLQAAAAPLGLMFGPDPSSHSRATLGGMIGNDACGNHSVAYGRTSDHVVALDLVLADGTLATATRSGIQAVHVGDDARVALVHGQLRAVAERSAGALRSEFDRCPRQVSGYAAQRLLPERGFDIARLLVGSEGTLAVVVGATLALVPVPVNTELLVVGYPDLIEAARDVPLLLEHAPAAIEALDLAIVETLRARRGKAAAPALPAGDAWLYVEFTDTIGAVDLPALAARVMAQGRAVSVTPVTDAAERAALWRVREEGAGLASNLRDGTRGRPGWEDAAVPPQRLAEYLEGLRALQREHGFRGVLYGHFGAGCVHVRFDFDTATRQGRKAMREFIRAAAALVARCGGSVSGEHGDGRARAELLPLMYSPASLDAFAAIKHAFDPAGILNPGVIVGAPPLDESMPTRHSDTAATFRFPDDRGDLGFAADRCVGIGRCVSATVTAMCPTHAVTGIESDGTRGRARIIQDLFNGSGATSAEAVQALDTCLSCRACASDCPTGVDIATYKAEVLHRHYRHRLRPLSHYTLGRLPQLTRVLRPLAPLINAILIRPRLHRWLAMLLGISTKRSFPRLAAPASRSFGTGAGITRPQALLYMDPVSLTFTPGLADDARRVFESAGIACLVVAPGDTGLSLLSTGQLHAAQRVQRRFIEALAELPPDVPIIALEPSAAASIRHDLPLLLNDVRAERIASRVRTFTQGLQELAPNWVPPRALPHSVVLQPHCHERATFTGPTQAEWLRSRGVRVAEAVGCCGMGGSFGFEPGHEALSTAVAARSLLPAIDAAEGDSPILADGFGCRCQVDDLRPAAQPMHLASLLSSLL